MFIAFLLASALSLLSVLVERTGPELVPYGNLCGPTFSEPCYKPALKGGVPFAYLFDTPGVSVERQLAFVEDDFHLGALILDIAFYFTAFLVAIQIVAGRLQLTNHSKRRPTAASEL